MEPVCSGQIEIGFIDRGHFDLWRKAVQDSEHFLRALTVALGVPFDENRVRAQFRGGAQRQGGIAERTLNLRASYDAAETTPR